MNKKIIFSLGIIGLSIAIVVGGTIAFFSDTERSTGNTFSAGGLDLKIDSESHYNGMICRDGVWVDPDYVECGVNLLLNSSFDTPIVPVNQWQIFPDGTPGLNWSVEWEGGDVSYGGVTRPELGQLEFHNQINGWDRIGDDEQYTELDSDWVGPSGSLNGEPASVRISRWVDTVPGKNYTLSFWFSPRPNTPASDNVLEVVWDGTIVDTITAAGGSNTNWTQHSYSVIATSNTTKIEFADKGTPNSLGTFLDEVRLEAVECEQIPGTGMPCEGTWEETDLEDGVHKFFYFTDLKPGDWGEDTISIHVYDNDSWGRLVVDNLIDIDNGCEEPEVEIDNDCNTSDDDGAGGELRENLLFWVWLDQGSIPGFQNNRPEGFEAYDPEEGDNIWQEQYEPLFISPGTINQEGEIWNLWEGLAPTYSQYCTDTPLDGHNDYGFCHGLAEDGRLVASTTYYFGVAWELPIETDNGSQGDIFGGDITFQVEQHRNNENPFGEWTDEPEEENPETRIVYFDDMGATSQYGYEYDYGNTNVSFTYDTPSSSKLVGTITATGLKPYATYQIKFEGIPTCKDPSGNDQANEYIGYSGRWWNNTTNSNTNDAGYESNSVFKGGTDCIIGYLVWDFITADENGNVAKTIETTNSYHVLRCGGGVCNVNNDTYLAYLDAAHPSVKFCPADKVNGQIERFTCGGLFLDEGVYNLKMILTEESFHQGNWTSVMDTNIDFELLSL